jgi:hypothetical protein
VSDQGFRFTDPNHSPIPIFHPICITVHPGQLPSLISVYCIPHPPTVTDDKRANRITRSSTRSTARVILSHRIAMDSTHLPLPLSYSCDRRVQRSDLVKGKKWLRKLPPNKQMLTGLVLTYSRCFQFVAFNHASQPMLCLGSHYRKGSLTVDGHPSPTKPLANK